MQIRTLKEIKSNQKGFTLIELLIVIGILAILLAITLIAINPTQHFQSARNTQRQSDVTAILDAIYQAEAATGKVPNSLASLTATATAISSAGINLCSDVVPTYIADLPGDPDPTKSSRAPSGSVCTAATTYDTGYKIAKSAAGNRFTVSAPYAEGTGVTVSVTR